MDRNAGVRNRWGLLGVILLGAILVPAGCRSKSSKSKTAPKLPQGVLRVTPSQLFTGDLARIEPHVASISGCVKVEYAGPRKYLQVSTEIWEDGESRTVCSTGGSVNLPLSDELSVTLHDIGQYTDDLAYRIVTSIRGSSGTTYLRKFDRSGLFGTGLLGLERIDILDDEDVIVWGYAWFRYGETHNRELALEEQARKAKWAVVLKLKMLDETD